MFKRTDKLISVAEKLNNKYLIKTAVSDDDVKRIIAANAEGSTRYIPAVDGISFVNALKKFDRNASIKVKYESGFFSGAKFTVTPFTFEEGTPDEVKVKFSRIPAGIKNFLDAQGKYLNISEGAWIIVFP